MSNPSTGTVHTAYTLRSDNGSVLNFSGQLYCESSYYEEDSSTITRLRLFLTDAGEHVYSIVSGSNTCKTSRYYQVSAQGENCRLSDGVQTLHLPGDLLFAAVFGLCGIAPDRAEELRPVFDEALRMNVG